MPTEDKYKKWNSLCESLHATGRINLWVTIVDSYSQPYRKYHNLEHIAHCLEEFESAKYLAEHPDEIEFAIWFHDMVYNPKDKDNEEKSANLACEYSKQMGLPAWFAERVRKLVLLTKHDKTPDNIDSKIITDIDLSILGSSKEDFDNYGKMIREEYRDIDDEEYREGRISFIKSMLNRGYIYSTDFFRDKYEDKARKNLEWELSELAKP